MKKKLLLSAVVLLALLFVGYRYLYKSHRDIASETPEFSLTTVHLLSEFSKNAAAANLCYANKTVLVSGKITSVDAASHSLVLDGKLSATLLDPAAARALSAGSQITLKGRLVGYDDLLEELKMDQSTPMKQP